MNGDTHKTRHVDKGSQNLKSYSQGFKSRIIIGLGEKENMRDIRVGDYGSKELTFKFSSQPSNGREDVLIVFVVRSCHHDSAGFFTQRLTTVV
jgi:hypothetical protein